MGLNISITVNKANADANTIKQMVASLLAKMTDEPSKIIINHGISIKK